MFMNVKPRSLLDEATPALIILRSLKAQGWTQGHPPAIHTAHTAKVCWFGGCELQSYWTCLLHIGQLIQSGLSGLRSDQRTVYYSCLLQSASPKDVLLDQPADYYTAAIEGSSSTAPAIGDDDVEVDVPMASLTAPAIACQPVTVSRVPNTARIGRILDYIDRPLDIPPPEDPGGSSSSSSDESDRPIASGSRACQPDIGDLVPGLRIKIDEHLKAGQPGHYKRYQVTCPLCMSGHWRNKMVCSKSRNIGAGQTRSFGDREPVAYLAVWAERAEQFVSAAAHMAYQPSYADIDAYMERRGWHTAIQER